MTLSPEQIKALIAEVQRRKGEPPAHRPLKVKALVDYSNSEIMCALADALETLLAERVAAWEAGREAAAKWHDKQVKWMSQQQANGDYTISENIRDHMECAVAIRALPPPASLAVAEPECDGGSEEFPPFPLPPSRIVAVGIKPEVLEKVREALEEYACAGLGKCEMYGTSGRCVADMCAQSCGDSALKALALLPPRSS